MVTITSGRVAFSKTVQDQQFEPRRAEVEMTFEVAEGERAEEAARAVGALCRAEALALVGALERGVKKSRRSGRFRRLGEED